MPELSPQPTHYTETEGGLWKKWPSQFKVTEKVLKQRHCHYITFGSPEWTEIKVHSLAFDNPMNGSIGSFRRWDCVNGWTRK